jgi:hypothetical protein
MPYNLDLVYHPFGLFQNYVLNFSNLIFDDDSLNRFIEKVQKNSIVCSMVTNIITTQEITESQKILLKQVFTDWKYHIMEDPSQPFQKKIIKIQD